ncbi:uncharacterized protein LOC124887809 [Capsicum annuum]|uniref:uncharacterized protein LOC124887809 n=1 Tax=Capsicum annuum TaxID=4072 RepID=UPI001FB16EB6|nr:uncharacterized protein LOC124887809 [Capsicum annuum]
MYQAVASSSGKIWSFIDEMVECTLVERLMLWDSMEDITHLIQDPWVVARDFNVIVSKEEKLRGLPVTMAETEDFKHCINLLWFGGYRVQGKFLNMWLKDKKCLEVIKDNWDTEEIATLEEVIKEREKQFEENPSGQNRQTLFKAQADLNLTLKREEEFWRQKAGFDWFKHRERNTKFFHEVVKGRRSRLKVFRIQDDRGVWHQEEKRILNVVIKLDMMKAYDRVECLFLIKVLRKMGFSELFIGMVYRLVENIWYSVLINGQLQGININEPSIREIIIKWWNTGDIGVAKAYY